MRTGVVLHAGVSSAEDHEAQPRDMIRSAPEIVLQLVENDDPAPGKLMRQRSKRFTVTPVDNTDGEVTRPNAGRRSSEQWLPQDARLNFKAARKGSKDADGKAPEGDGNGAEENETDEATPLKAPDDKRNQLLVPKAVLRPRPVLDDDDNFSLAYFDRRGAIINPYPADHSDSEDDFSHYDTLTWTCRHLSLLKGERNGLDDMQPRLLHANKTWQGSSLANSRTHVTFRNINRMKKQKQKKHNLSSKYESLDYDICENLLYQTEQRALSSRSAWLIIIGRWIIYFFASLLIALSAFVVEEGISKLSKLKHATLQYYMEECSSSEHRDCVVVPLVLWLLFNMIFASTATAIVVFIAPEAAGGGLAKVKSYMNGVRFPGLLTFKALVAKIVGVILSVAGGLAYGKEGPLIHIGSIVAARLSYFKYDFCQYGQFELKSLSFLHTDTERRDIVAAGAAAGISAGFGAPIGGVLFSLEESASFWDEHLIWRVVFCSLLSSFFVNIMLSAKHGHPADLSNPGLVVFGRFDNITFELIEIPIFLLMAVFGGITGGCFVRLSGYLMQFRQRYVLTKLTKIMETAIVASVIGAVFFLLLYLDDSCVQADPSLEGYPIQFGCPKGLVKSMSYLVLNTPEKILKIVLHARVNYFSYSTLTLFLFLYWFLTLWTYGLPAPGGLLIPGLMLGSIWGRMVGMLVLTAVKQGEANIAKYALIGAACQLGGMTRMTIALTVMLMECIRDITLGGPIMLCLIIAKITGDKISVAIEDQRIELLGIPLLPDHPPLLSSLIPASDIMSTPVATFHLREKVEDVVQQLTETTNNGFPVVEGGELIRHGQPTFGVLKGLILRSQLLFILEKRCFCSINGEPMSCLPDLSDFRTHSQEPIKLRSLNLSEEDKQLYVDLRPFVNPSPYTVFNTVSLPRMFKIFRGLGLRHLIVVNDGNEVVGMVTRIDMARFRLKTSKMRHVIERKDVNK